MVKKTKASKWNIRILENMRKRNMHLTNQRRMQKCNRATMQLRNRTIAQSCNSVTMRSCYNPTLNYRIRVPCFYSEQSLHKGSYLELLLLLLLNSPSVTVAEATRSSKVNLLSRRRQSKLVRVRSSLVVSRTTPWATHAFVKGPWCLYGTINDDAAETAARCH